jgi:predicted Zn-dependent protease
VSVVLSLTHPRANWYRGKVFVFTAILPLCQDDDGIAAVLGHEIAHAVAHHAAERMSRGSILTIAAIILNWTLGLPDFGSDLLLTLAFDRPNGRAQESEADYIGLMMMAQSCYNPEGAVLFWKRMQKAATAAPPEFLSTHPSDEHRVANISQWLPEAEHKRDASECGGVLDYGTF